MPLFLYLQFKGSSTSNKKICSGSCSVNSLISVRNLLFTMTEAVFAVVVCSPSPPPLFLSSILLLLLFLIIFLAEKHSHCTAYPFNANAACHNIFSSLAPMVLSYRSSFSTTTNKLPSHQILTSFS